MLQEHKLSYQYILIILEAASASRGYLTRSIFPQAIGNVVLVE